jgi:hypothetical protein
MYLIGCTYNFCWVHHELSKAAHRGSACTPAMAAGLSDHVWSICELLSYRIALPPWIEPERRKQSYKQAQPTQTVSLCPSVRLRKGELCSTV